MFFFFSSRRRHTRCLSDWSSDVCSSDLEQGHVHTIGFARPARHMLPDLLGGEDQNRSHQARSEERRVGKGVDLGGRRNIKKKKEKNKNKNRKRTVTTDEEITRANYDITI